MTPPRSTGAPAARDRDRTRSGRGDRRDLEAAGFTVERLDSLWGTEAAASLHRGSRVCGAACTGVAGVVPARHPRHALRPRAAGVAGTRGRRVPVGGRRPGRRRRAAAERHGTETDTDATRPTPTTPGSRSTPPMRSSTPRSTSALRVRRRPRRRQLVDRLGPRRARTRHGTGGGARARHRRGHHHALRSAGARPGPSGARPRHRVRHPGDARPPVRRRGRRPPTSPAARSTSPGFNVALNGLTGSSSGSAPCSNPSPVNASTGSSRTRRSSSRPAAKASRPTSTATAAWWATPSSRPSCAAWASTSHRAARRSSLGNWEYRWGSDGLDRVRFLVRGLRPRRLGGRAGARGPARLRRDLDPRRRDEAPAPSSTTWWTPGSTTSATAASPASASGTSSCDGRRPGRAAGGAPRLRRFERVPETLGSNPAGLGATVARVLDAADWLAAHDDEALGAAHLRVAVTSPRNGTTGRATTTRP